MPDTLIRSLNAVTATGAGGELDLKVVRGKFGLQVTHTGAPTACVVALQGTIDGTNWFTLGSWSTLTSGDIVFITDKPVLKVRANLTTLTGGASPTVSAWVAAV